MPTVAAAKHTAGFDNVNKWLHLSQCHVGAGAMRISPGIQLKSTSSVRKVMEVLTSELCQIHPLSIVAEETCCPFHPVTLMMCFAHPFLFTLKVVNQEDSYLKASPLSDIQ